MIYYPNHPLNINPAFTSVNKQLLATHNDIIIIIQQHNIILPLILPLQAHISRTN